MPSERIGSYELLMRLAAGGMGVVDVARKVGEGGFERLVVVKRVHRHLLEDRAFRDMLRDEARVAALLRHPNVVPLFDVVDATDDLALVLEYVESVSLAALLAKLRAAGRRMPPAVAARVVCDALAGLHAAHEAVALDGTPLGLIHRDVSPQNVIVGSDGTSRLVDFGVAKAAVRLVQTSDALLKGKLAYMAPEQATRRTLDRRTDVFSAGVVLYEALAGERLQRADADDAEVLLAILVDEPRRPSAIAPDVPRALDDVVARALAREPDERFASAAEMEEALEAAVRVASRLEVARLVEEVAGPELAARREALSALARASSSSSASAAAAVDRTVSRGRSRRRRLAVAALGAALVVGGAALALRHLHARAAQAEAEAASRDTAAASVPPPEPPPATATASRAEALDERPGAAASATPSSPPPAPRRSGVRARGADLHRANPYAAH